LVNWLIVELLLITETVSELVEVSLFVVRLWSVSETEVFVIRCSWFDVSCQ